MPKILIYITSRYKWIFLFYGTDFNENRAHVHVGKYGIDNYCKIWLEPEISVEKKGELTELQVQQIIKIVQEYKNELITQWNKFKAGKNVKTIIIKK
ncbi:MAG: DUF4160 domain-containing protein [Paludibacteraceae bacterium]|nr:DUF4160 domain-containing protein [Paludibacteraceae bacterium]